jgi:Flp pilus assembly protein TadD
MDCLKRYWWAAGLVCGLAGCGMPGARQLSPQDNSAAVNAAVARSQYNVSTEVAPPRKPASRDDKLATCLRVGDLWVNASVEKSVQPAQRQELLGKAVVAYEEGVKLDPKNAQLRLGLARAYGMMGQKERALEAFKLVLQAEPKNATAWCELGLAHARWKDYDPAVENISKAAELAPENAAIGKTLGLTLARAGRTDEAYGALLRVMPEDQARLALARMHFHLNQDDAAARQAGLALQANPKNEDARTLLAQFGPVPEAGETPAVATMPPAAAPTAPEQRGDPLADPNLRPVVYEEPAPVAVPTETAPPVEQVPVAEPTAVPPPETAGSPPPPVTVADPDAPAVGVGFEPEP